MSSSNDFSEQHDSSEQPTIVPHVPLVINPGIIRPVTPPIDPSVLPSDPPTIKPITLPPGVILPINWHKITLKDIYTDEEKAAAQAAIAESFMTPGVQSLVDVDMNNFTQKTKDITRLFDEIENQLRKVDALRLNPPLTGKWTAFKLRYRNMLWASRDLAARIAASAEQFHTAIIPLAVAVHKNLGSAHGPQVKQEIEEVIASIDEYIQSNDQNTRDVKNQSDQFKNLATDVVNFGKSFGDFGQTQQAANKAAIEELQRKITALGNQLASIENEIIAAARRVDSVLSVVNVLKWIPFATLLGLGAALAVLSVRQKELNELRDQKVDVEKRISDARKQKKGLEDQNALIIKTRMELENLATTKIVDIADGLAFFETIWSSVNADCVRIKSYMEKAKMAGSKPIKTPTLIVSYMKSAHSIYQGLAVALNKYAAGITNSGLPRPA